MSRTDVSLTTYGMHRKSARTSIFYYFNKAIITPTGKAGNGILNKGMFNGR